MVWIFPPCFARVSVSTTSPATVASTQSKLHVWSRYRIRVRRPSRFEADVGSLELTPPLEHGRQEDMERIGQASEVLGVREPVLDGFNMDGEMPTSRVRRIGARVLKKSTARLQPKRRSFGSKIRARSSRSRGGRSDEVPDAADSLLATPRTHDT